MLYDARASGAMYNTLWYAPGNVLYMLRTMMSVSDLFGECYGTLSSGKKFRNFV